MGRTLSKKMLPLIILRVLEMYTDETHDISIDQLARYVSEFFYIEETEGIKKLIRANIAQMNMFFKETDFSLGGRCIHIESRNYPNMDRSRGYVKRYRLMGRILEETEAQLLCDSILFSPGIDERTVSTLIGKVKTMMGISFGTGFDCVKRTDIVKRTDNQHLFEMIDILGKAIKRKRKVRFFYKKTSEAPGRYFTVSSYHIVINSGKYYLLCNVDGKESISSFRLDRMEDMELLKDMPIRRINELKEVEQPFRLKTYLEEHPRMSYEKTVTATLLIRRIMLDAVASEFKVTCVMETDYEEYLRVRIISTQRAICNWIINVPDEVRIESTSDQSVIDLLTQRALENIANYKINQVQFIN